MRDAYMPTHLRAIFVLESPPKSGKYFYNPEGSVTEQLFAGMMRFVGIYSAVKSKAEGLRCFRDRGFLIVDASYEPVDGLSGAARDRKIKEGYRSLVRDLNSLNPDKQVPLVLVKANICRLLEQPLQHEGFKVANGGIAPPFPGSGRQREFHERLNRILGKHAMGDAGP